MTMNDFEKAALRTAKPGMNMFEQLQEGALGLAGEAGEVADYIKKGIYQGHLMKRDRLAEEIGDVLWYCALLADATGVNLDEIAQRNIDKLRKRYPEGFDSARSVNRDANVGKPV